MNGIVRNLKFILVSLCLFSVSGCFLAGQQLEAPSSNSEPINANNIAINENNSQLQHEFAEIPFEALAQTMSSLIQQEKFAEAESILNEHIQLQTSTRGGFYYPGAVLSTLASKAYTENSGFLEKLNQWILSDERSTLAFLVRSGFYYHAAWDSRGEKLIRKTPDSARQEYARLLRLSWDDLENAAQIDPNHPLLLLEALEMGRNVGMDREVFESYFDAITAQIPHLPQAYQIKSTYLEPQWHGSEKELLKFVRESSRKAPKGSVIPLIVSQAHRALRHKYPNSREYYNRKEVWSDIESSFARIIRDFPRAGLYPAWYAELAFYAHKDDIAEKYIDIALSREPNNKNILKIKWKIMNK